MKVLGIGNALVDVLVKIEEDSYLEEMNLPKGSMQLIDEKKLEVINKVLVEMDKSLASGGSASNTITCLGKLGIETGFIGKIGKDFYGEYYKADLEKYGVKSHLIAVNSPSGVANTFISRDGERTFGTFLGAAASLTPEELDESIFSQYDYLYIEGYLVQDLELIEQAFRIAKNKGLKIILDLASYNIVEENLEFLLKVIPEYVDILFSNQEEMFALLKMEPEEALPVLSSMVDIAVVKMGACGSWIQNKEEKVFIPTAKVNCIDTTGAGDLYAAGFLYGLLKNFEFRKCGETGTFLAQQVIQCIGAKIIENDWEKIESAILKK